MDLELLNERLGARGEPGFRARQVWEWAAHGAGSYEEMTNLPRDLREVLAGEVPYSTLRPVREALARDGTEKALFETGDGRPVEAVLMRYRDGRRSLCLSSQSGCPLTCTFCATGQMRFGRNLTASEIVDQALHFRRKERFVPRRDIRPRPLKRSGALRAPLTNAVFMGMGEPLMNLDAVLAACERLPEIGIAASNTAISTVGWIPGIERMTREGPPVRLALSVHAADETLRSELMPVNERYPLREVLDACLRWHERRRRQVFVEYLMLDGVNDRYEQAVALAELLEPRNAFKVNLIPFNPIGPARASPRPPAQHPIGPARHPTDAGYAGSSRDAIAAFRAALEQRGLRTTVRLTRGRDIDAACGQLAARG
jgi:23S rRNA (adenine2503-C2)-methyltransferase